MSMLRCPKCKNEKTNILETRTTTTTVRRRRKCWKCKHTWSTIEIDAEIIKSAKKILKLKDEIEKALEQAKALDSLIEE